MSEAGGGIQPQQVGDVLLEMRNARMEEKAKEAEKQRLSTALNLGFHNLTAIPKESMAQAIRDETTMKWYMLLIML